MRITEVKASTACSPSKLPGLDWALNPYRGCSHACVYCYSADILRMAPTDKWGASLEVRKNLPVLLAKERKKKKGVIGLGTVTDPYQQVEEKTLLTRYCLEQLALGDSRVCIQTKSDLVTRDIDILARMNNPEVGITVTTMDAEMAAKLEPGAPPPDRRMAAVRKLVSAGIRTWVFLGPIIPGMNDSYDSLAEVVRGAKIAGASKIIYDYLRLKPILQERMLKEFGYEKAHVAIRDSVDREWRERVSIDVEILCEEHGIAVEKVF
ncbi:MAG: radical SAM protein [Candidatus Thermoplasmatota archaeon]|nr:radical SAM protein [Euryarchaeota archaeon]MBU4032532.1 radical SAM protein [Candidatus Thermoplasmatota archaeon]MBU4072386.1 radical SAM protein [Candidatus Thermoplasmatota archaeon]MBU4145031.1 radical SAM protein [Candidatus Thermoplasmatota archaeon]MBU4590950.1 radical SAM protein [Candidatus Thermoplasmatota archaeon]